VKHQPAAAGGAMTKWTTPPRGRANHPLAATFS
jgi:hypothetical protein